MAVTVIATNAGRASAKPTARCLPHYPATLSRRCTATEIANRACADRPCTGYSVVLNTYDDTVPSLLNLTTRSVVSASPKADQRYLPYVQVRLPSSTPVRQGSPN